MLCIVAEFVNQPLAFEVFLSGGCAARFRGAFGLSLQAVNENSARVIARRMKIRCEVDLLFMAYSFFWWHHHDVQSIWHQSDGAHTEL